MQWPTLYSKDAKGAIREWTVSAVGDIIEIQQGISGGKLVTTKRRAAPTNTGRANARDAAAQAAFEAEAAWTKKLKVGYFKTVEEAQVLEVLLPTLAHNLIEKKLNPKTRERTQRKRPVRYPAHGQKKYNGLRTLSELVDPENVRFVSREGTVWENLQHLEVELLQAFPTGSMVDGEVYLHGLPLQMHNSYVKRLQPETRLLQLVLYDYPRGPGVGSPWEERWEALVRAYVGYAKKKLEPTEWDGDDQQLRDATLRLAANLNFAEEIDPALIAGYQGTETPIQRQWLSFVIPTWPLQLAGTYLLPSEAEIAGLERRSLLAMYEGVIIRQFGYEYAFRYRTEALIKHKTFTDAEFKIIGMESREYFPPDGSAPYLICDKCICENHIGDQSFEVVPRGTHELKAQYWEEREDYIGTQLVVRYLEVSMDGVPQGNPVGVAFRLDEDMYEEEDDSSMWN